MSFSSDIKSILLKNMSNESKKCCKVSGTFGEYITTAKLKSSLERDYSKFLEMNDLDECCIKSIIMGSFLSSGYITDPNQDYHLEIIFKNKALADYYIKLLSILDFMPKYTKRLSGKNYSHVVYIKEADQISTYLSILGVDTYLLKFEQIRVEKDFKNKINRSINCEVANISKIAKASFNQIEAINALKAQKKYNSLNEKLKQAAKMRLKYPEDSLELLSKKMNITKSGLKHRLDKLIELSKKV